MEEKKVAKEFEEDDALHHKALQFDTLVEAAAEGKVETDMDEKDE